MLLLQAKNLATSTPRVQRRSVERPLPPVCSSAMAGAEGGGQGTARMTPAKPFPGCRPDSQHSRSPPNLWRGRLLAARFGALGDPRPEWVLPAAPRGPRPQPPPALPSGAASDGCCSSPRPPRTPAIAAFPGSHGNPAARGNG